MRKLFSLAISLSLTLFFTYLLCENTTGDPRELFQWFSQPAVPGESKVFLHLKQSPLHSIFWEVPLSQLFWPALLTTFALGLGTCLSTFALCFFLGGYYFSKPRYRRFFHSFIALFSPVPSFVYLLLFLVFFLSLGYTAGSDDSLSFSGQVFLGILAWTFCESPGFLYCWTRSMDRFEAEPFSRTAIAQGVPSQRVYRKHALPYLLRENREVLKQMFLSTLTGSLLVESLLGIHGLGRLAWDAWRYRDFPLVFLLGIFFCLVHWVHDGRTYA